MRAPIKQKQNKTRSLRNIFMLSFSKPKSMQQITVDQLSFTERRDPPAARRGGGGGSHVPRGGVAKGGGARVGEAGGRRAGRAVWLPRSQGQKRSFLAVLGLTLRVLHPAPAQGFFPGPEEARRSRAPGRGVEGEGRSPEGASGGRLRGPAAAACRRPRTPRSGDRRRLGRGGS